MPPDHELFCGKPLTHHLEAFYADQLEEKESIERRLKEGGAMGHLERMRLMEALTLLKGMFAEAKDGERVQDQDPLSLFWEEQIARGEEPDLDLTLEDLRKMGRA